MFTVDVKQQHNNNKKKANLEILVFEILKVDSEYFLYLQINPNSKAYNEGIQVGDYVETINGQSTHGLEHQDAQKLIKAATDELILELQRLVLNCYILPKSRRQNFHLQIFKRC